jgi:hypothetical protein
MKKVYINPRIRIVDTDMDIMEVPFSNGQARSINSMYQDIPFSKGEYNSNLTQEQQEGLGAKESSFDD